MSKPTCRKCDRCCPDGGAFCDPIRDADGRTAWQCRNCHNVMPRRVIKATGKLTPKQRSVIERIKTLFGGTLQHEFIGRKVFITANNNRNWIAGNMLSGVIGPAGKLELTLYRLGGDKKITDRIGIEVYLKD